MITRVVLATDRGEIHIDADEGRAPLSAGDFLRYVRDGSYAGGLFQRAVTPQNDNGDPVIEIVQAAIAEGALPREPLDHESTEQSGIAHTEGVVSLPRGRLGTGTAASFFICVADSPGLDFGGTRVADGAGFAAFGKVVDGMDVVREIHRAPTLPDAPVEYLRGQLLADPVEIRAVHIVNY